jgi:hypothetical protein
LSLDTRVTTSKGKKYLDENGLERRGKDEEEDEEMETEATLRTSKKGAKNAAAAPAKISDHFQARKKAKAS